MSDDVVTAVMTKLEVTAAVTTVATGGVHRKRLPKKPTFPAIVVSEVDDIADIDSNTGGWAHTRIQCTVWATDDGIAGNLSKLIRKALHGIQNTMLPAGTGFVYVVSIRDAGSVPDENTDISVYLNHRDFKILYDCK